MRPAAASIAALAVALTALACGGGSGPAPSEPSPGAPLFQDPLTADTGNGWPAGPIGSAVYTFAGGYQVGLQQGDLAVSAHPSLTGLKPAQLHDVSVAVTARKGAGAGPNTRYGVFCRADPVPPGGPGRTGYGYRFEIAVDPSPASRPPLRWTILRDADTSAAVRTLSSGAATAARADVQAIRGDCRTVAGTARLTLFVDGSEVGHAVDTSIPGPGWPGVSVVSAPSDRPQLTFTDFSIRGF